MDRILVIDDDRELCDLLKEYLVQESFQIDTVHDGKSGVSQAIKGCYSFIVLDVMLPELNGFEVLRQIRAASDIPVMMLTARGDEIDRIVGLEMGADDYLPKPFNPRELVARLRAIQRRMTVPKTSAAENRISKGDITLDLATRSVTCGDELLDLTSVEFSVLETLLRMAGTVLSRDELSRMALGRELNHADRSIDVHVSNLRKKIRPFEQAGERIKSVRGIGYIYTC